MLDDLREQASDEFFMEDDEDQEFTYNEASDAQSSDLFLGMTPVQRFVIAVMLFLIVGMIGTFFLLVTEKIYLPIF